MWSCEAKTRALQELANEKAYRASWMKDRFESLKDSFKELSYLKDNFSLIKNNLIDFVSTSILQQVKKSAGNSIKSTLKLMRYVDILFNEDAFCHFGGDLLQRFALSLSCSRTSKPSIVEICDLIATKASDYMQDPQNKADVTKLVKDFIEGEPALRNNKYTYVGMRWTRKDRFNELDNLLSINKLGFAEKIAEITKKANEKLFDIKEKIRELSQTMNMTIGNDDTTITDKDYLDFLDNTLKHQGLSPAIYQESTQLKESYLRYSDQSTMYTKLDNPKFETLLTEFSSSKEIANESFKSIYGCDHSSIAAASCNSEFPKNSQEKLASININDMFVFDSMNQFKQYFPTGVNPSSFIVLKDGTVFIEETMAGVHTLFSKNVNMTGEGETDQEKLRQVVLSSIVAGLNEVYDTTNYCENIVDETITRLKCSVKTDRKNIVMSGSLRKYLGYVGVSQMINKAYLVVDKLVKSKNQLKKIAFSDQVIGDILYELGKRLREPPIYEDVIRVIKPGQVLKTVIETNPDYLFTLNQLSGKLRTKQCDIHNCNHLDEDSDASPDTDSEMSDRSSKSDSKKKGMISRMFQRSNK